MMVYTITEAKAQFSALIEQVLLGEEIIIKKAGVPVAVLKPYVAQSQQRVPGALAGKIKISPDFDDLPKEIAQTQVEDMTLLCSDSIIARYGVPLI